MRLTSQTPLATPILLAFLLFAGGCTVCGERGAVMVNGQSAESSEQTGNLAEPAAGVANGPFRKGWRPALFPAGIAGREPAGDADLPQTTLADPNAAATDQPAATGYDRQPEMNALRQAEESWAASANGVVRAAPEDNTELLREIQKRDQKLAELEMRVEELHARQQAAEQQSRQQPVFREATPASPVVSSSPTTNGVIYQPGQSSAAETGQLTPEQEPDPIPLNAGSEIAPPSSTDTTPVLESKSPVYADDEAVEQVQPQESDSTEPDPVPQSNSAARVPQRMQVKYLGTFNKVVAEQKRIPNQFVQRQQPDPTPLAEPGPARPANQAVGSPMTDRENTRSIKNPMVDLPSGPNSPSVIEPFVEVQSQVEKAGQPIVLRAEVRETRQPADAMEGWVDSGKNSNRQGSAEAIAQSPLPHTLQFEPLPVMPETDLRSVRPGGAQAAEDQTAISVAGAGQAGSVPKTPGIPTHQVSTERQPATAGKRGADSGGSSQIPVLRLKAYASADGTANAPPTIKILKVSEPKVEFVDPSGQPLPVKQGERLDTIDGNLKIRKLKPQPIFDYDQLHKSVRGISRSPESQEQPSTVDR